MARNAVLVIGKERTIQQLLKAAERYQKRSHTRKLLRPAARTFRDALRTRIRGHKWTGGRSKGAMARSIRTFSFGKSQGVHVGPRVGGRTGKGAERGYNDGFHMGWHEFGTSTNGLGHAVRPKRFMQKTIAAKGAAINMMMKQALMKDFRYLI